LVKISLYGGLNGSQTSAPFGFLLSFSPKKKKKTFSAGGFSRILEHNSCK